MAGAVLMSGRRILQLCVSLCFIIALQASRLNAPRVLLPYNHEIPSNFTLKVYEGGCYRWWDFQTRFVPWFGIYFSLLKFCSYIQGFVFTLNPFVEVWRLARNMKSWLYNVDWCRPTLGILICVRFCSWNTYFISYRSNSIAWFLITVITIPTYSVVLGYTFISIHFDLEKGFSSLIPFWAFLVSSIYLLTFVIGKKNMHRIQLHCLHPWVLKWKSKCITNIVYNQFHTKLKID